METIINGFTVSIEKSEYEWTDCYVTKGRYSASLTALQDCGELPDENFERSIAVAQSTIDKITAFAEKHGF